MKRAVVLLILLLVCRFTPAESLTQSVVKGLTFDQKLNQQVSLGLMFRDEGNAPITLGQCLNGKPAILMLVYYECPMLCNLVLNGVVESLQEIKPAADLGERVIFVSIDPHETPELAVRKKATYLKRFGRPGTEDRWHFLCGSEADVRQLAREVGYHYVYYDERKQYAHPSGIVVLTPEGRVSRYFFGVSYPSAELQQSLADASLKKTGFAIQAFVILCSQFVPLTGKFIGIVMGSLRLLAIGTVLVIVGFVAFQTRRERARAAHGKERSVV
jgi:protein SCO1/2